MAKAKYILKCGKVELAVEPGFANSVKQGEEWAVDFGRLADKKEIKALIRHRLASVRHCIELVEQDPRSFAATAWKSDAVKFLAQAALLQRIVDGGKPCYVRLGNFMAMDQRPLRFDRPIARLFSRNEATAFIADDKAGADMQIVEA